MNCPKCHAENREGMKFCEQCGTKMELQCPNCKAAIPLGKKFCGECGHRLAEPTALKEVPDTESTGERKHVTVLFSDLSGYTAMSEKLDPEEVKDITTRVFREVADIVSRYEGFVEKYIGDAVVALFGVPASHEDDHTRAIRAAQEIHKSVEALATDYEAKIGRRLAFHTGINTGLVVTGEVNVEKGTHGVAGDTINLASRLCGLAKPGEIIASESTYSQCKGTFSFERLDPVSLKGKAELVTPYRFVAERVEAVRGLATHGLSSPLVGRSAELAAIKASFNRLLDGQGGILSVIGEAGLGKSRIMEEIRRLYQNEHFLWLEGRTLSYSNKISYWPLREILWQYVGITELDSDIQAWGKFEARIVDLFSSESKEILPYLASLVGLVIKGELGKNLARMDGDSVGKQIYLSSRRFFERLAQISPVVLIFEDLHWADESTVALIAHLFPLITRVPLLICVISRPEDTAPASRLREMAAIDHERRYTEIRLNPLSPTECTNLMDNLLLIENLPSRIRQIIVQKADGNPFFLEEIMRTLIDRSAVIYENSRWRASAAIETITIPDTVQGVIIARIDRLDEELKQILKTASVIGRTFFYRVLRAIEGAIKDLDQDLDKLTATELIREKQKVPELEYVFKHALVQESTYESILLKKRIELHDKVAGAIEQLFADRLDEFIPVLAYHYAKAENWEKAQEYLFKAAEQAGRIAADAEALTHYEQAMETYAKVFGDKWDPIERASLERKMGEAFRRRGEHQQAFVYFRRALDYLGRPLPTSSIGVRVAILREILVQIGHLLAPWLLTNRAGGEASRIVVEEMHIYDGMGPMTGFFRPMDSLLIGLRELNQSERTGNSYGLYTGYLAPVWAAGSVGAFRISGHYARKAVSRAERSQNAEELHRAYLVMAFHEMLKGASLRNSLDYAQRSIEACGKGGYWNLSFSRGLPYIAGHDAYSLGEFSRALEYAHDSIRFGEESKDAQVLCWGLQLAGFPLTCLGRYEEAIASFLRARELAEAIPDFMSRLIAGDGLGWSYLRQGDLENSKAAIEDSERYRVEHALPGRQHAFHWFVHAGLCLAKAERVTRQERSNWLKKARELCKKALKSSRSFEAHRPEARRNQGTYEWLKGRHASARKWWLRSIAAAEEREMRYEAALTRLEMGKRLNDQEDLNQAAAIFAGIGADFALAETRRLLQRLADRNAT
jgi:class 3 adenylate cyclase/tetratricopeptide (TPR) repeat protein